MDWFSVDKKGLAAFVRRRGVAWVLYELVQNALDQQVSTVTVSAHPVPGRPLVELRCEDDDPHGFERLSHAWTLFADTGKRKDATKAGRFTLGEKLVLALAEKATIMTTTGSVTFDESGRHVSAGPRSRRTKAGSVVELLLRMTRAELEELEAAADKLIPRQGVALVFNGAQVERREKVGEVPAELQTEFADEEGVLRRSRRKTLVTLHAPRDGEQPFLYELGIPVVELDGGEPWHVVVHQRVPLNAERDNVTPAFLRDLRVQLLNHQFPHLPKGATNAPWVKGATESADVSHAALDHVMTDTFGKARAIFDPSDPEANKTLMNEGVTVVSGGSLTKAQWERVKEHGLMRPSGQIRPSGIHYSADGTSEKVIDPSKYTLGQDLFVRYAKALGLVLLGNIVAPRIVNAFERPQRAWWGKELSGGSRLALNLPRLGKAFFEAFETGVQVQHHELLLHEFAHEKVSDHLTHEFHREVGRLGSELTALALTSPGFFKLALIRAAPRPEDDAARAPVDR